tara:strand:+ start:348 stop:608 length:261 start_codon:yes stop_codon:yes gene_type:complete
MIEDSFNPDDYSKGGSKRDDLIAKNDEDEYITRCVVDPVRRSVSLYSNEGDEKHVECEEVEEFMNVLSLVRKIMPDDIVTYVSPLL